MNGKVSKLIRKVSKISNVKTKVLKRLWKSVPKTHRHSLRNEWQTIIQKHNNNGQK